MSILRFLFLRSNVLRFAVLLGLVATLLCIAEPSAAHLSGFTDTSIQITQQGVRLIYTTPADNLRELGSNTQPKSPGSLGPPEDYAAAIEKGFGVESHKRACRLAKLESRSIREIAAYQYQAHYVCPQGLDNLTIFYRLFTKRFRGHVNYTRVFMAGEQMQMRFSFDKDTLEVPVSSLLSEWDKSLTAQFLDSDPNRNVEPPRNAKLPSIVDSSKRIDAAPPVQTLEPVFIWLGMRHIGEGADHVLFIVALLLVHVGQKSLLVWISCFTLAHSLTLGLSYFGWVRVLPRTTEPLVALTVLAIGLENLWLLRKSPPSERTVRFRPALIFLFGLIHGLGLSYQLTAQSGRPDLARLLLFNVGVELGQLAIVAALWVPLRKLETLRVHRRLVFWSSAAVAALGLLWFVDRTVLTPQGPIGSQRTTDARSPVFEVPR